MTRSRLRLLEPVAVLGMIVGTVGMFQPWAIELYQYGFAVLALSTLLFIVVSHVPAADME